ncbi:alpha/beta fold hydrolase [Hyphobacterium sp.]|uniref:alpha/beta fold hydrolase n=1 Tax=Hyphobacterium sp. TaxID=2004662 RepID=UPI003B520F0F
MPVTSGHIDSPTGARLATHEAVPDGELHGVVQINHGLAEHGARYAPFLEFLSAKGWAAIVHDHRGHGQTTAPDGAARLYAFEDGWSKLMADVDAVHQSIRARFADKPVVVFGHSMGGTVALNQVMRQPQSVAGCAIWNANIDKSVADLLGFVAGLGLMVSRPDKPAGLIDQLSFKAWDKKFRDERPAFGWLSRDLEEVDKYAADPLCGWTASWSLWRDFAHGIKYAANNRHLKHVPKSVPFHLVGGSEDPATDGGDAIKKLGTRLRRQGFGAEEHILDGFRHETLNEKDRETVMERFAAWLSKIG